MIAGFSIAVSDLGPVWPCADASERPGVWIGFDEESDSHRFGGLGRDMVPDP